MHKKIIEAFRDIPTGTVYECNDKCGDMNPAIRPLFEGARIAGPAFTVKSLPGDLSAMRKAVDAAPPDHVLVIDGGGSDRVTTWGGGASIAAQRRGLAGVVTNGSTRDSTQIREMRFPVFCAGVSVRGGVRTHPGWLQVAVAVGDVVVQPGDFVVADGDGVVVIASERVEPVLELALARLQREHAREARLRAGEAYNV